MQTCRTKNHQFVKSEAMPRKSTEPSDGRAKPASADPKQDAKEGNKSKSVKLKAVGPEVQMKKGEVTRIFTVPGPVYNTTEDVIRGFGYALQDEIDSGAYGQIYKVQDIRKKTIVAGKVLKLGVTSPTMQQRQECERELIVMEKVRHPYVVDVYCHFVVKAPDEEKLFIFMRLADGGNFSSFLRKTGPIEEAKAKLYYAQMLCGVNHMHNMMIAHRDIKLQNILLLTFPKSITADFLVLIADFGVSHVMEWQVDQFINTTICGTPAFMAPEVRQKRAYSPFQADVYALGIVIFLLLTGVFPFNVRQPPNRLLGDQLDRRWRWPEANRPSEKCDKVVMLLLEPNPQSRMKLIELINSPWIIAEFKLAHDLSDSLK